MRLVFFSLFLIILVSFFSVAIVNSTTGAIPVTKGCGAGHTYAFYRTLAEKEAVVEAYKSAGFVPVSYEEAPERFKSSGYEGFVCMRPLTNKELGGATFNKRPRVITRGSSKAR
ncbi:hypothetical protein D6825_04150 [Candidatus Woesearchaeota archaeon]|nr:MAG: hypothetical protein D6825_04150 [Candidatus Woesearchaeota archaeon]